MTCLTVRTTQGETAEEVAIFRATTTSEDAITVLTDSQAACRNYVWGRICNTALRILEIKGEISEIEIVWVPGHTSFASKEAAHAAVRGRVHLSITYEGQTSPAAPKT